MFVLINKMPKICITQIISIRQSQRVSFSSVIRLPSSTWGKQFYTSISTYSIIQYKYICIINRFIDGLGEKIQYIEEKTCFSSFHKTKKLQVVLQSKTNLFTESHEKVAKL